MSTAGDNRYQTYVRRRGRMTQGQSRALEQLAPRYCLPWPPPARPEALFGRAAPLGVEIGFGMGQAFVDWALRAPEWNLLGLEIYQPGIGAALLQAQRHELTNMRVIAEPAEAVFDAWLPAGSVAEIRVFYPDPWPKKRHGKRRLIQPEFVERLALALQPGGLLWLATDWAPYADWMLEVLEAEPRLANRFGNGQFAPAGDDRIVTRFQARGDRLGHRSVDLQYQRKAATTLSSSR